MCRRLTAGRSAFYLRVAMLLLLAAPAWVLWAGRLWAAEPEQAVFELKEVSVFADKDNKEDAGRSFGGAYAFFSSEPDAKVRAYPKLKSKRPLYGSVTFDRDYFRPGSGVDFYFALDESGEKQADEKKTEKRSLLESLGALLKGGNSSDAGDYDLLYFDANHDFDLTNDPVLKPLKEPPRVALSDGVAAKKVKIFDYLSLPVDYGPGVGTRPFRIMPQLVAYSAESAHLNMVATTMRKGTIRIGKKEFDAELAHVRTLRCDHPLTELRLASKDANDDEPALQGWLDYLCAMREIDGQLYSFSATPRGDKLTVKPYRGDFGTLEISSGGKDVEKPGFCGIVASQDQHVLALGNPYLATKAERPRQQRLPVGDFCWHYLAVDFGRLSARFSPCRDAEDSAENSEKKPLDFPIKIRKDQPYVLRLADKPVVQFLSPTKQQTFQPGDTISFKAMLKDLALDAMIAGLTDTTSKEKDLTYTVGKKTISVPRYKTLEPMATITDSAGKEVASGKMPFG